MRLRPIAYTSLVAGFAFAAFSAMPLYASSSTQPVSQTRCCGEARGEVQQSDNDDIVVTSLGPTAAATSREQIIRIGSDGGWETVAIKYSNMPSQMTASAAPAHLRKEANEQPVGSIIAKKASTSVSETSRYRVQLASLRTPEVAEAAWNRLRSRESLLHDLPHQINEADLGERGVHYRLQVGGFETISEAKALCSDLSNRKIDCIVVR